MENKNKKRIYRNWRVGDKCWFGKAEGVVDKVIYDKTYAIRVICNNIGATFTENGSYDDELNDQSLSYVEGEIGTMPFDYEPELKVDDLVYVKCGGIWCMGYFHRYGVNGIVIYADQKKSNEKTGAIFCEEYSITNPLI